MRYCVASNESESIISSHMAVCYVIGIGGREYFTLGFGLRLLVTGNIPRLVVV